MALVNESTETTNWNLVRLVKLGDKRSEAGRMRGQTSYLAHDVGEDGTRRSDESADDGHHVVVQHEALRTEGPAGVAVEDRDHDRHVSTCNHGNSLRQGPAPSSQS